MSEIETAGGAATDTPETKKQKQLILAAIVGLYVLSLAAHAITYQWDSKNAMTWRGIEVLVMSVPGVLVLMFGGVANLLFLIALVAFWRSSAKAFPFAIAAVVVSLDTFRALAFGQIVQLHLGAYVWFVCIIALAIATYLARRAVSPIAELPH